MESRRRLLRSNASLLSAGLPQPKRAELQGLLEERQAAESSSPEVVALFSSPAASDATADPSPGSGKSTSPLPSAKKPVGDAAKLYATGNYGACSEMLASRLRQLQTRDLQLLALCAYSTGDFGQPWRRGRSWLRMSQPNPRDCIGKRSPPRSWLLKLWPGRAQPTLVRQTACSAGGIYRQRKFYPDAEQEYRKALALRPGDAGALFGLSLALIADGRNDERSTVAQTALATNPDDPEL